MSRAYRVAVKESVRRVIRAGDRVRMQLEMLEILPCHQMGALLAVELARLGFRTESESEGDLVIRVDGNQRTAVNVLTAEVEVSIFEGNDVAVEGKQSGETYDDRGANREQVEQELREQVHQQLDAKVHRMQAELQQQVTDELESRMADARKELDQACNRAIAAALKIKAAQMGKIKELTEDPSLGSLTIVVEL